jgi:hypothetical protein
MPSRSYPMPAIWISEIPYEWRSYSLRSIERNSMPKADLKVRAVTIDDEPRVIIAVPGPKGEMQIVLSVKQAMELSDTLLISAGTLSPKH